ncbi:MAG: hypothetical protein AB1665_08580 [Candidatus Thermoplasmatota archaeon]
MSRWETLGRMGVVLRNQESAVGEIKEGRGLADYLIGSHVAILLSTIAFGAVLGTYAGGWQIGIDAVKMPILFLGTLYIALPVFYILSVITGCRITAGQMAALVTTGYAVTSIVMISFTPLLLFFILTAKDYTFTIFLTTGVLGLSGYFGLVYIFNNFRLLTKDRRWVPSVLVGMLVIVLVGTQLAWTLRPYFHSYEQFIKPVEGNFYAAMTSAAGTEPGIALPILGVFALIAVLMLIYYIASIPEETKPPVAATPWHTTYPAYPTYPPPPALESIGTEKDKEDTGTKTDARSSPPGE